VVVSPDVGGLKMASAYSHALKAGLGSWPSDVKNATDIEALTSLACRGETRHFVDDLTENCRNLTSAARILKERGATEVSAAVSHAVFPIWRSNRLKNSSFASSSQRIAFPCVQATVYRSQPCASTNFSAKYQTHHDDESVSSLFKISDDKNCNHG
jgi:ribose-phosphate pyrophosphokinase